MSKKILLIACVFSFFGFHKFYVSNTSITYSEKEKTFQIISRIFMDDFEKALESTYHVKTFLGDSKKELPEAQVLIQKYIIGRLKLYIDDKPIKMKFLGTEYDDNLVKFFIETKRINIDKIKFIKVESLLLTDDFSEQQNIINIKIKDKKIFKTEYLNKEKTKLTIKL